MESKLTNAQISRYKVKKWLSKVTPTPFLSNNLSDKAKISRITKHMTSILKTLGVDLKDDSLKDTPKRVAKMFVLELFAGLKEENFPKITTIENKMNSQQTIAVKDIRTISVCEHHFVTIDGLATVSYLPKEKIIGLSKINRIVDYFSRRPQVQERLTIQIADCLEQILETKDIAVHIRAKHYCVISRGVKDTGSETETIELRGKFGSGPRRDEFLEIVR